MLYDMAYGQLGWQCCLCRVIRSQSQMPHVSGRGAAKWARPACRSVAEWLTHVVGPREGIVRSWRRAPRGHVTMVSPASQQGLIRCHRTCRKRRGKKKRKKKEWCRRGTGPCLSGSLSPKELIRALRGSVVRSLLGPVIRRELQSTS